MRDYLVNLVFPCLFSASYTKLFMLYSSLYRNKNKISLIESVNQNIYQKHKLIKIINLLFEFRDVITIILKNGKEFKVTTYNIPYITIEHPFEYDMQDIIKNTRIYLSDVETVLSKKFAYVRISTLFDSIIIKISNLTI